jgi:peptidoglycan hydrolase-like protein with peptidoglycan-binding domain
MTRRISSWGVALAAALFPAPFLAATAFAQDATEEAMQALPAPTYEAARTAFEELPQADRAALQDALVWTGDYASTSDGSFGRRTFEAIQAFQRRAKRPVDGIVDRPTLAALLAAGQRARSAAGFAVVVDPAAGVRIGIPQKLLPKRSPNTIGGTRYQSADERVTLDTRAQPGSAEDLRALYERNLAIQTAGRAVTYKLMRPDFFVIAGETANGRFYSRYAQEGEAIRGFSIGYDKALGPELDRVTVAIANSFQPFGAAQAAPPMADRGSAQPGPASAGSQTSGPVRGVSLTGLAVAPRRVLVPGSVRESCREPRIDGAPARIVSASGGLAVLEPASPRRTASLRFADTVPTEGAGLVAFFSDSEGGRAVVTPAEFLAGGRILAPLQDGAAGGVVLDRTGAIVGVVGSVVPGRRAVAGLVPPAAYPIVPAAAMRAAAGDAPAGSAETRGSAAAVLPALARIECGGDRAVSTPPAQPAERPAGQGIRLPPPRP